MTKLVHKGALIQTVVAPEIDRWVKQQATAEGISVAAWLRQLIVARQLSTDRELGSEDRWWRTFNAATAIPLPSQGGHRLELAAQFAGATHGFIPDSYKGSIPSGEYCSAVWERLASAREVALQQSESTE